MTATATAKCTATDCDYRDLDHAADENCPLPASLATAPADAVRQPSATVVGMSGRVATAHLIEGDSAFSRVYEIRLDGVTVGTVEAKGMSRYSIVGSAYCTPERPFLGNLRQVTAAVAF